MSKTKKPKATNYYKLYMPVGGGRGARTEIVFFSGEGPAASAAYGDTVDLALELKIPTSVLSVYRTVPGVPSDVPEVGAFNEVAS